MKTENSAKLDVRRFPRKPQLIDVNDIPMSVLVYQQILSFQWFQLAYQVRYVSSYAMLLLTARCHGNLEIKIPRL